MSECKCSENEAINPFECVHLPWCEKISDLRERVAELENPWQPIETAPTNDEYLLAIVAGRNEHNGKPYAPLVIKWNSSDGCWQDGYGRLLTKSEYEPTHWMPLPEPPENSDD